MLKNIMHRLEHTKLREVVDSIQICFDPDDLSTLIEDDVETMEQYKQFESMINECIEEEGEAENKSKWIIRMEMNMEEMLDKDLTMDDIHFALKNTYKEDISCVYSDYNSDKLVFRIRLNSMLNSKKKVFKTNPLDQSDEIYLLKNFQDQLLDNLDFARSKKY